MTHKKDITKIQSPSLSLHEGVHVTDVALRIDVSTNHNRIGLFDFDIEALELLIEKIQVKIESEL